jgi:hypothetical protein
MKYFYTIIFIFLCFYLINVSFSYVGYFDNSRYCYKVFVSDFGREVSVFKFGNDIESVSFQNNSSSSSLLIFLEVKEAIIKKDTTFREDLIPIFQSH